jgi:hypothetical protein
MVTSTSPSQIHLALAAHGMTVSYTTHGFTNSSVSFGLSKDKMKEVEGETPATSYIEPFFHHHVTLEQLEPGKLYYYKCGDMVSGESSIRSFTTAPDAQNSGGFSASIFGDWGYGVNGHAAATRQAMEQIKEKIDLVWHLGDIAYADDAFLHDKTGFEYENVYNAWMQWISNITSTMPYMVAAGNHESECHSPACLGSAHIKHATSNFSAYNKRWRMPSEDSGGVLNMWYSFDYGYVHFVTLNTETDFPGAAEETHGDSGLLPAGGFGREDEYINWLEADLAKANASRHIRPWIFAGGHRPLYTSVNTDTVMVKSVEHLLMAYGVDIYFSGHQHSYARSTPVYNSIPEAGMKNNGHYVDPTNPVYVLAGGAGCDEMKVHEVAPDGGRIGEPRLGKLQDWNVYDDVKYGTGVLQVINRTTVKWQYIHSEDMVVADEFYLTKTWH